MEFLSFALKFLGVVFIIVMIYGLIIGTNKKDIEDYKHKILKICIDAWCVGLSVAKDSFQATGVPAPLQKTTIDSLYNNFIVTDLDKHPDFRG